MRLCSWMLGVAGVAVTAASWISDPAPFSIQLALILALCAVGGMLPLKLAGLQPLPVSLPLVGAVAMVSEPSAAMLAGMTAGAFTVLSPRRASEPPSARPWLESATSAAGLSGLLALAAGMVSSGYTRFGLIGPGIAFPFTPPLLEAVRSVTFAALVFWLSWCAALLVRRRLTASGSLAPHARALAAALGVSLSALAIAVARLAWGDPVVLPTLLAAALVALAFAPRLARQEMELVSLRGRARTGISLVESMALAIEAKDQTSERHLRRMRVYCLAVGRRLGLPEEELEALEYAALLHDIGKLVVPESILSKPASLSREEYQVMSSHAKVGAEILESTSLSSKVARMVRHHHERYDGSGYPDGLMGMEIPLGARILAAVDTFEALTSQRPHRHALSPAEAAAYIGRQAGVLFDPRVAALIVEHHAEIEKQVTAEEAARPAGTLERSGHETLRVRRPLQAVLDRIASSHMEIYSLHEISQALGKTLSLEESFLLIAGKVERLIHYSACVIYLLDGENEVLWPRFVTGQGADRLRSLKIPLGRRITGWATAQKRAIAISRSSADPTLPGAGPCADLEDLADDPEMAKLSSAVVAPLLVEETVVGAIALYDDAAHAYAEQEEQLLAMVARQVAGAVRAGLLWEQTQENALTDSLTGLPNARYLYISFDQEATRARQDGSPLTLMVMDIDRFRDVNDDYGHHAGDRFLIGVAKAIRSQMRICDTCIRYSGDEFVAILPRLGAQEVEAFAERLMEAARDYCLETRPGRPLRLNLSLGYATMPADGDDFEALMAVATARMKQIKDKRRRQSARPLSFENRRSS